MYELVDKSYLGRPAVASPEVRTATAHRIAILVETHGLREVTIVLHGGEPLLHGPDLPIEYLHEIREKIRERVGDRCTVKASMQTNGSLLHREGTMEKLAAAGIRISVSLDGGTPEFNKNRLTLGQKKPTLDMTSKGLGVLRQYPELYKGIISVANIKISPIEFYESMLQFGPPELSVLFPYGNHDNPPPGLPSEGTPYADWYIELFNRWINPPHGQRETKIRLFDGIIRGILGYPSNTESVGLSPINFFVVDTDGSIQGTDALKSAYTGAPETGLNVFDNDFAEALRNPMINARRIGEKALSHTCQKCDLMKICGGGHFAERFKKGSIEIENFGPKNFMHVSVFCKDLEKLIRHILPYIEK
jgi:uncharacterized protein